MKNKENKFLIPEAEIIELHSEDIITDSDAWWGHGNYGNGNGTDIP